jgi:hypothetical protein
MTFVVEETIFALTRKVAVVDPCGTVIAACGNELATTSLVDKATIAPPAGAGPVRVMVPVELLPPTTVEGFMTTDVMETGTVPAYVAAYVPAAAVNTAYEMPLIVCEL